MCREGNDDEVFATTNIETRNRSEVCPSALAVGITTNARGPGGTSLRGRFVLKFARKGKRCDRPVLELVGAGGAVMVDVLGDMLDVFGMKFTKTRPALFFGSSSSVMNEGDILFRESIDLESRHQRQFACHVTFSNTRASRCEPAIETLHNVTNLVDELVKSKE